MHVGVPLIFGGDYSSPCYFSGTTRNMKALRESTLTETCFILNSMDIAVTGKSTGRPHSIPGRGMGDPSEEIAFMDGYTVTHWKDCVLTVLAAYACY